MLVDGFNDLHGFRASVPDDGEFDGVMGFAVPSSTCPSKNVVPPCCRSSRSFGSSMLKK